MDYIDLLQIHRFDPHTPQEETMEALHDLVKSGKVRYIGASSMWAVQFAQMQFTAEKHGWTKFISMQNHYNLLYREEEREMNRFCNDTGVGLIPVSSPLRFHQSSRAANIGNFSGPHCVAATLLVLCPLLAARHAPRASKRQVISHPALPKSTRR